MYPASVVVTGASGQIGRSTLLALVKSGVSPTALVRGRESPADCTTVGDWLASDVALDAIRGAEAVVHLAAFHVMYAVHNKCCRLVTLDEKDLLPKATQVEAICTGLKIVKPTQLVEELGLRGPSGAA